MYEEDRLTRPDLALRSQSAFFELAQLAMIVVIRTVIDYFLSKEIESFPNPKSTEKPA